MNNKLQCLNTLEPFERYIPEIFYITDLVIIKNIFLSANGNLVGKKNAKIVTTDTSSFQVA